MRSSFEAYPLTVSNVSPTVYFASSRANRNFWRSLPGQDPSSFTRSSDGLTSQKMGTTFFRVSIIRLSSCKQKFDSQYIGEKTATPTLHSRIATSILSKSLSPGFMFLLSKNGRRRRRRRWWYSNPATFLFVSIPRWLMNTSHGGGWVLGRDAPPPERRICLEMLLILAEDIERCMPQKEVALFKSEYRFCLKSLNRELY